MRTLLLPLAIGLMLLGAGCFGSPFAQSPPDAQSAQAVRARARRHQAVAALRKMGGKLEFEEGKSDNLLLSADLHGIPVSADLLASLGPFTKARRLNLFDTGLPDAALDDIKGAKEVKVLNLSATRVTDAGLASLGDLSALEELLLNNTQVSDVGLKHLRGLSKLRELALYETRVTDEGLYQLSDLKKLQKLTLSGWRITDRGVASLKGLSQLSDLILVSTRVSSTGAQDLRRAIPKLNIIR